MVNCQFHTMIRSFLYVPLNRLLLLLVMITITIIIGEVADCTESIIPILKNAQRRKKNPEQRFAKL